MGSYSLYISTVSTFLNIYASYQSATSGFRLLDNNNRILIWWERLPRFLTFQFPFPIPHSHSPFPIPHSTFSILVTSLSQLFIAGSKGSRSYLTNKKAFTVLCSVFEALRKRPQHERSGGETREVVECFSLRLECSRQFLRPLRQNRTQSRLLHLFYDKESIKFPTHYFLIFKTNY